MVLQTSGNIQAKNIYEKRKLDAPRRMPHV
jgi:hypothetical protein